MLLSGFGLWLKSNFLGEIFRVAEQKLYLTEQPGKACGFGVWVTLSPD